MKIIKQMLDKALNSSFKRQAKIATATCSPPLAPYEDPTSIGNVLVDMGCITKSQLEQAVELQREQEGRTPIGLVMCENGWCTVGEVTKAVEIQRQLRLGLNAQASLSMLSAANEEMSVVSKQLQAGIVKMRTAKKQKLSLEEVAG